MDIQAIILLLLSDYLSKENYDDIFKYLNLNSIFTKQ